MNRIISLVALMLVVADLPGALPFASAEEKFKSYDEAQAAAGRFLREQRYAEAQEPLEAALRLAPDDKARLDVYQALVPVYRQLPEIDKKLEANEYLIRHSPRRASRSNAARDLESFLLQRGKVDTAIERYESLLKEKPGDLAALSMLTVLHTRIRRNSARVAELAPKLAEVESGVARRNAEKMEKDAQSAPRMAATYLKDAAILWLEAGDKPKALETARKSAATTPRPSTDLLLYYWHSGLGDVFMETGEPKLAMKQFQAAAEVTKIEGQRTSAEKKLAEAKAASEQK